ncbi:MAG: PEP/pyruvate-binding domain-containing protein [Acidimicrobiales bacterium]
MVASVEPISPLQVPYVVDLGAGAVENEGLGGKGAALARLVQAGYPVPATGVVTISSYLSMAGGEAVGGVVRRILDAEVVEPEEVDAVFQAAAIDAEVTAAILELARTVGAGGPIAVRSSATVEDLHGSSFAGQYTSLLDIDSSNDTEVLRAVRRVWASLWHPAPSAYRRAFGIEESDVAMAVVMMRMIPATTAGVVFTIDPGGSGGARVEAVEGLGESLVSGQRTPSAWVVDRQYDGPGVRDDLPPVPARALELSIAIERRFDTPQDVEWAANGDEVFIVQARPITVLDNDDGFDTELDTHELTTAGIVEMVPGVLPPLRWEINRFLLEEAFRSVLDSLGVLRGSTAEAHPFVRRVRGRVAIDFDQLRETASRIPGAVEELEEQYFGASPDMIDDVKARSAESTDSGPTSKRGRWLRRLQSDLHTLRTRRHVIDQSEIVIRSTALLRKRRAILTEHADEELVAYASRLVDLGARGLAAELGVAASGAAAYSRLELQLASHLGDEAGKRAVQTVTARGGAAIDRPQAASAAIFAGPTWDELEASPMAPVSAKAKDDSEWRALRKELSSLPGWTRRRILTGGIIDVRLRLIGRLVADVVEQLHRREAAKAAVLELGGEVRRVHLEIGRRLVDRGVIGDPIDVELMTSAEIVSALTGENPLAPETVRRRRNWQSRYEAEGALPVRFIGIPDREPEPLPEGDVLQGWAASPGRRQGLARVVRSSSGPLRTGEVLVAEATDASWSPLFLKAGAVVVERGGPLSHAAILARELGLPAVLNVAGAASVLDGCQVSVDGDQGVVVIETNWQADD